MNKPFVYVTLFSLFWALNILLNRYVLVRGVHPLVLSTETLFLTSITLLVYFALGQGKAVFKGSRNSKIGAAISGIVGGGLAGIVASYGLRLSTSINFGFLIKGATAFTVLFAFLFLKEPLSKAKLFFVGVLLFGAYLLSTGGQSITPHAGDILIIVAAACYSAAAVINRKVITKDVHPDMVSFFRAAMGFLVVAPVAFFTVGSLFSTALFLPIFLVSLSQTLLFIYLNKTLSVASASYMTMMSMLVPVIVAVFAVPFFKESLNLVQIIGAVLIVAGGIATEKMKVAHHS